MSDLAPGIIEEKAKAAEIARSILREAVFIGAHGKFPPEFGFDGHNLLPTNYMGDYESISIAPANIRPSSSYPHKWDNIIGTLFGFNMKHGFDLSETVFLTGSSKGLSDLQEFFPSFSLTGEPNCNLYILSQVQLPNKFTAENVGNHMFGGPNYRTTFPDKFNVFLLIPQEKDILLRTIRKNPFVIRELMKLALLDQIADISIDSDGLRVAAETGIALEDPRRVVILNRSARVDKMEGYQGGGEEITIQ
jgi:hypothetical protein